MIKFVMMLVLAMTLGACSDSGNTTPTDTNTTTNTTNNIPDPAKTYPVITKGTIAQLAEVATVAIADAGSQAPTALEFAPNGQWLAVGHTTGATVFDLANLNGTPLSFAHTAKVNDVAWNSFGFLLATASDDKTVKVWDTATGEATLTFTSPKDAKFRHVAISNNDSLIAAAEDFSNIYILSATTGEVLVTISVLGNPTISDIAITADSASLVVSSGDNIVRIFDIATGEEVSQTPIPLGVSNFDLAADDKRLFISNFVSGGLTVLDITTGEYSLIMPVPYIHPKVALSADNELLVGFWNFGGAKLAFYDVTDLQKIGTEIALPSGSIDKIAYGSDGSMVATVGLRTGVATLSIWRVNS
jgi:WD40 repeat protein